MIVQEEAIYNSNSIGLSRLYMTFSTSRFDANVTAFKNWLSTNNITVYYHLATPTKTQITDTTLVSQLNALKNANTVAGNTFITTSGSNANPLIQVKY